MAVRNHHVRCSESSVSVLLLTGPFKIGNKTLRLAGPPLTGSDNRSHTCYDNKYAPKCDPLRTTCNGQEPE
jgi:hypothetical protein